MSCSGIDSLQVDCSQGTQTAVAALTTTPRLQTITEQYIIKELTTHAADVDVRSTPFPQSAIIKGQGPFDILLL